MIHGIQPGPLFIGNHPDIFWGFIISMYVGNVLLLLLNLPLIGIWVRFLKIPYVILIPFILLFCLIGAYTLNNNVGDAIIMLIFGVFGYLIRKVGLEAAPFILALVLGPIMERCLRQSLMISHGDPAIFLTHPISAVLLGLGVLSILFSVFSPAIRRRLKEEAG